MVHTVETFDMEMVKRYLDKEGFKYVSAEHGFLTLSITEEYGLSWDVGLNAEGEPDNQIYVLRSSTFDMDVPRGDRAKALALCNDWNRDMRWPKVCLYAEEPATDTAARLMTMSQLDCGAGIHQELLDDFTRTFLSGSGKFWERAHQELGHAYSTAAGAADESQLAHAKERPVSDTEETSEPPVIMPTGFFTIAGRYPEYEPAQAIAALLSVSRQHGRPSYEELRDSFWVFEGGGYGSAIGCFAEPDGTSVIIVAGFSDGSGRSDPAADLMMDECSALEKSAHSTYGVLADDGISEAVASGALRQLRPSEVGPIPESASKKSMEDPGSSLRFDGLYRAQGSSYHSYLRFYEDGAILQVSTNGEPEQVARWFGKTHTEVPRGIYAIEGQSIEFSTASSEGTVVYKGQVFDDTVELSSHSYMNGHEDQATYSFVQVALH